CRDVLAKETAIERIRFLGNLDRDVFAAVLGQAPCEEGPAAGLSRREAVAKAGTTYSDRLKQRGRGASLPLPTWQAIRSSPATPAVAGVLRPRVIDYDAEGRPTTQQDVAADDGILERFGWYRFMSTSEMTSAWREEHAKSLVFHAISTCR
ncbi:MAG: hypothetical protein GY772_19385, partial [bacterium]|nr:hypothetical protein [bacterium]